MNKTCIKSKQTHVNETYFFNEVSEHRQELYKLLTHCISILATVQVLKQIAKFPYVY